MVVPHALLSAQALAVGWGDWHGRGGSSPSLFLAVWNVTMSFPSVPTGSFPAINYPQPPYCFLLTYAPPFSPQGSSMNYKQTATRRSRTAALWQRSWGAVLSSPWRASLCEPPPAPCPEHLAAPDLPMGVAGCPLPARPEGLGGSQQGEGNPFTQLPNSPPTPWTFLFPPPLTVLAFPNRF